MATVTCPVCGMQIERGEAVAQREYDGQTYYLCCDGCLELFSANPGEYIQG